MLANNACPICHETNLNEEFDVIIENDIITSITKMENYEDYIPTEGDYKLFK
jgi:RNA polymerase subunit RPABC4/transcription elongation factor Spt4